MTSAPIKVNANTDSALHGAIAQALGVPKDQVIPPSAQNPIPNPDKEGVDFEDLQEQINAFSPWQTPTVRVTPNSTRSHHGFLDILKQKIFRQKKEE